EAHEAYEDHPPPERPLRVLEDGPSERVELPAAPAARPGAVARGRGAVGGAALVRARRAPRPRPPLPRRLVVGPGADELAAPPGLDGIHQKGEVRVGKRVDPAREGVRALHLALSHPRRRPSGRDVAKHRARWAPAQIYVWQRDCTTLPQRLDEHALIPTLVDCRITGNGNAKRELGPRRCPASAVVPLFRERQRYRKFVALPMRRRLRHPLLA